MKIFNIRFGLATNSSSSHSMVFWNEGEKPLDEDIPPDLGFGWESFTISSEEGKRKYLAAQLGQSISRNLPWNIAKLFIKETIGVDGSKDAYADHQSAWTIPCAFGTDYPDEQFLKELSEYILQPNLVILGGNDNSDWHPLRKDDSFNIPINDVGSKAICRYDDKYSYWSLFYPDTGTKVRFKFEKNSSDFKSNEIAKAKTSELVDVKISNKCFYGCDFCYMSSTPAGEHASSLNMYVVTNALKEMKVWEVALGGGEPTIHPEFCKILKDFREAGIVPNFTTKSLTWLRDPKKWIPWLESTGAFAYTPNNGNRLLNDNLQKSKNN